MVRGFLALPTKEKVPFLSIFFSYLLFLVLFKLGGAVEDLRFRGRPVLVTGVPQTLLLHLLLQSAILGCRLESVLVLMLSLLLLRLRDLLFFVVEFNALSFFAGVAVPDR